MAHCVDNPLVYLPDARVAWQDAHSPVFTYTYSAPFLDLPAKLTESEFDNGHCCDHVDAVIRLSLQPQESVPAAGMDSCHLVTVAVSSKRFNKIQ
jgi:hypothetical protein